VYWLAGLIALFAVGLVVGLIWADTSNAAGVFAGVTNVVSVAAIIVVLVLFARRRRRSLM
jgi:uncharacterized membrane protein